MEEEKPFSQTLEEWLHTDKKKTISDLDKIFSEKSFALTFMILMAIPALPLPTGGLTHVFEVITMLLALELIALRKNVWLPKRWKEKEIGPKMQSKTIPFLIRIIKRTERISKPRMSGFLSSRVASVLFGTITFIFALGAFFSPPFTGLDTLPSLGAVILSLGFILEDIYIVFGGIFIGTGGLALSIGLGTAVVTFFKNLF